MTDFIAIALGLRAPTLNFGGGGGSGGPTLQQKQLATQQNLENANLNLEENAQRKTILSSMFGTRVFRGSALSRALRGNTPGNEAAPGPSPTQVNTPVIATRASILDEHSGSGNTASGGSGASGGATAASSGGYSGTISRGGVGKR